jgi:hypothetical protein
VARPTAYLFDDHEFGAGVNVYYCGARYYRLPWPMRALFHAARTRMPIEVSKVNPCVAILTLLAAAGGANIVEPGVGLPGVRIGE